MKKRIIILVVIMLLISGCNKKEIAVEPISITTTQIKTKSCLITNNFYSDQCIEGNQVSTSLIDYVNIDYEFEITSGIEEFDYHIYEDTYIVIEQDEKIIYEEKVDNTKFSDIKDGREKIVIEGTEKIYPKPYIEKINKIVKEKGYTSIKTYIRYIQKIKTTNNIKTDLLEVTIEPNGESIKVTTNSLT